MKCANCGCEFPEGSFCPQCGNEVALGGGAFARTDYSMKWYKFIKFALCLSAVLNAIDALTFFTGAMYEGIADKLYALLPSLSYVNIFAGVFYLGMAAFNIVTFDALKKYKENGPKFLVLVYALNILFSIVYFVLVSRVIGSSSTQVIYGDTFIMNGNEYQPYLDLKSYSSGLGRTTVSNTIVSIAMAIVNFKYFKTREDLFIF